MAEVRRSTDRVVTYLRRQERTALARIGAGESPRQAIVPDRWVREAIADLNCQPEQAEEFTSLIREQLVAAVAALQDRPSRVAAARLVYAHYVEIMRGRPQARPLTARPSAGKHMVYILFDISDDLLYVGITDRGPVRLAEHYRHKPWFPHVCRVEFERYETRADSERREKYLIQERAPLHNIQHNRGRQLA